MVKATFLGLLSVKLILVSVIVFNIPAKVHAGIFSLVSNTFYSVSSDGAKEGLGSAKVNNSQNLPILTASLSPGATYPLDSVDTLVDRGSVVVPRIGAVLEDESPLSVGRGGGLATVHKVKEGETVSSIAEDYGISQSTILWENNLTASSVITPGQELVILPFDGVRHKIEAGDTFSEIAEIYDVPLREIADFNRFDPSDVLIPGNYINIPGGEKRQTKSSSTRQKPSASNSSASTQPAPQPTPQSVSGYFRSPLNNYRITQGLHSYNAIDFAPAVGGAGSPIYAAAEGTVTESSTGWNGGYGNLVVISHPNGTRTLYAHNRVNYVSVGEWVSQGQVIGEVGNTGISTGPHVHFEVHGASNPFR